MKVKSFAHVQPFATHGLWPTMILSPWDFSGKNTGRGCHVPPPEDLYDPVIELISPSSSVLQTDSLSTETPGKSPRYAAKDTCMQCGRPGFNPWVGKIPWRRNCQPTPVFLPGKFHGQRSLVSYSSWGCKESDTTERAHGPLYT